MSEKKQKLPKSIGKFTNSNDDHNDVNDGMVPDNIASLGPNSAAQNLKTAAVKKATEPLESRTAKSANKDE